MKRTPVLVAIAVIMITLAYLVTIGIPQNNETNFEKGTIKSYVKIFYHDGTTEILENFNQFLSITPVRPERNGKVINNLEYNIDFKTKDITDVGLQVDYRNFRAKYELYKNGEFIKEDTILSPNIYHISEIPSDGQYHLAIQGPFTGLQNYVYTEGEYTIKIIPGGIIQYRDGGYSFYDETDWVELTPFPIPIQFNIEMVATGGQEP